MGDENPIRTLGDYSIPSHEGYQNTIEVPDGNNVVPLRSDTIRFVQKGCSFHGLRYEDPNQHLKDFLKLMDSLDLDVGNRERTLLLSKFEADFKQQQSEMTNKIDTFLKAINDRMTGSLLSDTTPQCSSHTHNLINAIKTCSKQPNDLQKDQPKVKTLAVNEIGTPKLKEPEQTLEDEFKDLHLNLPVLEVLAHAPMKNAILDKYVESLELRKMGARSFKLNIRLLEETDPVFGLADGTKSYPVGIVKNVEVYIGKLKLLEDFYVIDMEKDPATPLLVGRGFLATAKIDLGDEEVPYWTTLDFMDYHLPGEWEIARDAELNPSKDVLVFRKMVEFL
ncbi:MAK10-like protein [Tanacetum coccineum]|uniref:MAK10-like protein n=1 Tax=Tanacetum coccineum TaxID=301880 RepID=A0ABQ5HA86_9ASTR